MPAGRLDGRVSNGSQTFDLLPPFFNLANVTANFAAKGLGVEDMVMLSGAHSIGRAHCSSLFISDRLNATSNIDPALGKWLRRRCHNDGSVTVAQDVVTTTELDSQYYANVLRHRVLFTSDAALLSSRKTKRMVLLKSDRR